MVELMGAIEEVKAAVGSVTTIISEKEEPAMFAELEASDVAIPALTFPESVWSTSVTTMVKGQETPRSKEDPELKDVTDPLVRLKSVADSLPEEKLTASVKTTLPEIVV